MREKKKGKKKNRKREGTKESNIIFFKKIYLFLSSQVSLSFS